MKIYIVDNDESMLDILEELLSDMMEESDIQRNEISKNPYRKDDADTLLEYLQSEVGEDDYLLIDLYLKETSEKGRPFSEFESVKIAGSLKIKPSHILIYSTANSRGTEELLGIHAQWRYIPVPIMAFEENVLDEEDGFTNMRRDCRLLFKMFFDNTLK
ncbi:MAG: hypothetical protein DBX60_02925 [Bacillota bacterium]|nr:MAG: hypothetical protein DBX60_02925 [Bacillota bacterium]